MKKIIVLLMLVFIGASTTIYAQESKSESRRAERKAQRDAEKAREKIEEERAYANAAQAIKDRKFVLEADRVTFKRGRSALLHPIPILPFKWRSGIRTNCFQRCFCRS